MADLKPFALKDQALWEKYVASNADDPYGNRITEYAADWAFLMEERMAKGEKLNDIADACSHQSNYDGITGFMYGCATQILSDVWVHGEGLRRWHNRKTQIGTEGDEANANGTVLNPAIVTIETGEEEK